MAKHSITSEERAEVSRIFARQRKDELRRFVSQAIKSGRITFDTGKAKIEAMFREYLDAAEQRKLDAEETRKRNVERFGGVSLSEKEERLAREVEGHLKGEASEVALSEADRLLAEGADPKLRYRGISREWDAKADAEATRILAEHGAPSSRAEGI